MKTPAPVQFPLTRLVAIMAIMHLATFAALYYSLRA
jgi:hypothetical protein